MLDLLILLGLAIFVFFIFVMFLVNEQQSMGFLLQIGLGAALALGIMKLGYSREFALLGLGITLTLIYWMPK